jgi:hypothetical protein
MQKTLPRHSFQPGTVTRREWLRFLGKIEIGAICTCTPVPHRHWLWKGACNSGGYGHFYWRGLLYYAHRFAYIALGGILTPDIELDHLCRIHACAFPACVEPVPHKVNVLRGKSPTAKHAQQTHCLHGHALSGGNLLPSGLKRGDRQCKACHLRRQRNYYEGKQKKQRGRIHYDINAPPTIQSYTVGIPQCTNQEGMYMITSEREHITCKNCLAYLARSLL